jgi:ubiquinone/menaquinone biosynthesis C-methylase UbiE
MNLAYTIKTGKPALEASHGSGTTIWSYLSEHPEQASIFQEGLVANSRLILPALFSSYDFSVFQSVADMGGGLGELSKALLEAHPGIQVTLFDREEVIDQAIERGISPQIQLCAGNFFLNPPPRFDAYIFKNVMMDWSDEDYVRILKRCVEVMAPTSRLLIVEPVLTGKTPFTRFFSLQMAMMMRSAHHRTLEEHRRLTNEAGLTLARARELGLEQMAIECRFGATEEEAR